MINIFTAPKETYYGSGALEYLSAVSGDRALIVTDPVIRELGLLDKVQDILQAKGIKTSIYDRVEHDPSGETVWRIFSEAQVFKPDLFVGLGGGSPLDAAKGAWVLYENPGWAEYSVTEVMQAMPTCVLREKARFTAIPTTSGTGSEATRAAVVTDHSLSPPLKAPWNSPQLVPDLVILDPDLTLAMPPEVTANTGFDALVHAIECYITAPPSDLVDPLAIRSAQTICTWLPEAVADGNNAQAREKMHLAAYQAGLAFSNARLGLVHGLAHILGAEFGIPHGRANAFFLSPVFAFLYPTRSERFASLVEALDIPVDQARPPIEPLIEFLDHLKQKVGIPIAVKNSGLEETRFFDRLGPMATRTMDLIMNVPEDFRRQGGLPEEPKTLERLFINAWKGTSFDLA